MASEITSVGDEYIRFLSSLPPLNLRQDLEENLFNNDSKCGDCEYDSASVNNRSEGVFDKSSDEAGCWRCRAVNIPFDYFDRTSRTPRLRSPTPIVALDYTAWRGGGWGSSGKD